MWPAMAKPATSQKGWIHVNQSLIYFQNEWFSCFLQKVEIMKKPIYVSDNSIGCLKSIHFVFENGCSFGKMLIIIIIYSIYKARTCEFKGKITQCKKEKLKLKKGIIVVAKSAEGFFKKVGFVMLPLSCLCWAVCCDTVNFLWPFTLWQTGLLPIKTTQSTWGPGGEWGFKKLSGRLSQGWKLHAISSLNEDGPGKLASRQSSIVAVTAQIYGSASSTSRLLLVMPTSILKTTALTMKAAVFHRRTSLIYCWP